MTIEAGTVVKFHPSSSLTVAGSLVVNGTAADPVTLTSLNDDTVGEDTDGNGGASTPQSADWSGISVKAGSLTATHLNNRYASSALNLSAASAELTASSFEHTARAAVSLSGGSSASIDASFTAVFKILTTDSTSAAELRGSATELAGTAPFVSACNWGAGACSIDASYFDWGSLYGPIPPGESALACGSVIASPWSFNGSVDGSSIWSIGNCDGTPYSPASNIDSSRTSYNNAVSTAQALCDQGPTYADACTIVKTNQQCFRAASDIVQSQSLFPLSPGNLADPHAVGAFAAEQGSDYLKSSRKPSVSTAAERVSYGLKSCKWWTPTPHSPLHTIAAISSA